MRAARPGAAQYTVRFDRDATEQAAKLSAAFVSSNGWAWLIVGQEVAGRLVADDTSPGRSRTSSGGGVKRALGRRAGRHAGRCPRRRGRLRAARPPPRSARGRSEEREEAKQHVERFNAELGVAVVKALGKVKVDEAAVKILSALDVHGDLQKIAARGARYGFPGWALEERTKTGRSSAATSRAMRPRTRRARFLAGAATRPSSSGAWSPCW